MVSSNTQSKTENSRLKRLPENSHTIMLKFKDKAQRDECVSVQEFKKTIGAIAALVTKYNSTFEVFSWNILSGTSSEIENQEVVSLEEEVKVK